MSITEDTLEYRGSTVNSYQTTPLNTVGGLDSSTVIACFCGKTDYGVKDGNEEYCRHCRRRILPSDFPVPPRLAREVREILDRCDEALDLD